MAETIEQFVVRVCNILGTKPDGVTYGTLTAELPAFLSKHRQVVEVTGEDVSEADETAEHGPEGYEAMAKCINARLRARAVPASRPALDVEAVGMELAKNTMGSSGWDEYNMNLQAKAFAAILRRHATDTGWVQCPTTQTAGKVVVPEDGKYIVREGVFIHDEWEPLVKGSTLALATAIRRIDTDAPTTWIERTPTTTRAWTVDTIPAPDTPFWYFGASCPKRGTGAVLNHANDAARLEFFADEEITAWCYVTLPQDGPR